MKNYCFGIFFIVFISITAIPAFYFYATDNLAQTEIFTRPGWLYGLALVTALISAYICERSPVHRHRKA